MNYQRGGGRFRGGGRLGGAQPQGRKNVWRREDANKSEDTALNSTNYSTDTKNINTYSQNSSQFNPYAQPFTPQTNASNSSTNRSGTATSTNGNYYSANKQENCYNNFTGRKGAAQVPSSESIQERIARLEAEEAALKDAKIRLSVLEAKKRLDLSRKRKAEEEAVQAERERRAKAANNLAAGFSTVIKEEEKRKAAKDAQNAAENALKKEVERVLQAKSDSECLKVDGSADLDALKKSFRLLARVLHPDKAKVEGATDAFQRLNQAYNNLTGGG